MSLATWEICLVQPISLSEYCRPLREALVCVGGGEGLEEGNRSLNRAWHVVCAECMNGPAWGLDTQLCQGAFQSWHDSCKSKEQDSPGRRGRRRGGRWGVGSGRESQQVSSPGGQWSGILTSAKLKLSAMIPSPKLYLFYIPLTSRVIVTAFF